MYGNSFSQVIYYDDLTVVKSAIFWQIVLLSLNFWDAKLINYATVIPRYS